ncbi:MAG: M48 family metallopeptidase [Planctomycetota bacterium]
MTAAFLAALLLALATEGWLAARQISHVRARREEVPAPFRDSVRVETHRRAADYTAAGERLGLASRAWRAALLLGWTLGGGLDLLDRAWGATGWGAVARGTGFLLSALLLDALFRAPLAAWRVFRLDARFGFNRTTPRLFLADRLKGAALLALLVLCLAPPLLLLMSRAGAAWWLFAWGGWALLSLLLHWIVPRFVAPWFHRFTPLAEGEVSGRIEDLLARAGFPRHALFVMDGSRRSTHANAFFAGLGRSRRIVLFDTLLKALTPGEVEAVVALDLAHFRLRHVAKGIALSTLLAGAGFALLAFLLEREWFFAGLGASRPSPHVGLLLFAWVAPVLFFLLEPALAAWSRRHEFQADAFAARYSDAGALARALVRIHEHNGATLTPDPLHSAFHASHPPPGERSDALLRTAAGSAYDGAR